MFVGGISAQLWSAATTTYGIGIGAVVCIFIGCWIFVRFPQVRAWIGERLNGAEDIKLKNIFNNYLRKIASIKDKSRLYAEILRIVSDLAGSEDVSLLLKSATTQRYIVREGIGSKPMSFNIGEVQDFIEWLAEHRRSITRAELVECRDFAEVKGQGLQYCVQFHAEAVIPLVVGDELVGIVNIGCRKDGRDFEGHIFDVFDLMSSQFAVAISNANLHEGLLRQNIRLRQMDEFKSQLVANLSHELRTPLNSIIGLSDVLIEGGDGAVSAEQAAHLGMIRDSGKRLLDTVTTLLDLSRLESNNLALNVKRVQLLKIVEEALRSIGKKDDVAVKVGIDRETPAVYGDAAWINRLFRNLLGNAVKYTSEGSVTVDCNRAGDMLKVGIHDTGIGISRDDQKRIFGDFVQASSGAAREHEGSGVGLAVSKKIVELHGGRIWLDSKPGKGSHFFFTLPLKPNSIPSAEIKQ